MKCFLYVNSVSGLCLRLKDTTLNFNLSFDMLQLPSQGQRCRGRPRGASPAPSVFDQQAFC